MLKETKTETIQQLLFPSGETKDAYLDAICITKFGATRKLRRERFKWTGAGHRFRVSPTSRVDSPTCFIHVVGQFDYDPDNIAQIKFSTLSWTSL